MSAIVRVICTYPIASFAVTGERAFGAPLPTPVQLDAWTGLPLTFLFMLVFIGIGEEAGWTAFAGPRLLARHPFVAAWGILSGIRVIWHLPLMLSGELSWVLGVGGNAAFQLLLLWTFARSGGVWFLTAVWHGVLNTAGQFFFQMVQAGDQARLGLLMTAGYVVLAAVILLTDRGYLLRPSGVPAVPSPTGSGSR